MMYLQGVTFLNSEVLTEETKEHFKCNLVILIITWASFLHSPDESHQRKNYFQESKKPLLHLSVSKPTE